MSKSMIIPITLLGIISLLAIIVSIRLFDRPPVHDERNTKKSPNCGKPTYFLDDSESEKICSICLGRLGDSEIAICECGKFSHKECAFSMDCCPYCDEPFMNSTVRRTKIVLCPECGSAMGCGVCECGAAFPKEDHMLHCACGNVFDSRRAVCDRCGGVYRSGRLRPASEGIKIKAKN